MVVLNIFHVLVAIAMIALVLVQRGAGATAGAAFGSGASGTVFGARGAGTFLTKSTWVLAAFFCAISLTMAVMVSRMDSEPEANLGVISTVSETAGEEAVTAPEEIVQPAEDVAETDLPAIDGGAAETTEGMLEEQAAEDLPAPDGDAVESTDNNQGESASGADSDDS